MVIGLVLCACSGSGGSRPAVGSSTTPTLTTDELATARHLVLADPTLSSIAPGSTVESVSAWHPNAEFTSPGAPAVAHVAAVDVTFPQPQTISATVPSGNCDGTHFVSGWLHLIRLTPVGGVTVIVDTSPPTPHVLAYSTAGSDVMGVSPDASGPDFTWPEIPCHFGPPS